MSVMLASANPCEKLLHDMKQRRGPASPTMQQQVSLAQGDRQQGNLCGKDNVQDESCATLFARKTEATIGGQQSMPLDNPRGLDVNATYQTGAWGNISRGVDTTDVLARRASNTLYPRRATTKEVHPTNHLLPPTGASGISTQGR